MSAPTASIPTEALPPAPASGDEPDKGASVAGHGLLSDLLSLTKPRLSLLVLVTGGGGMWLSGAPLDAALVARVLLGLTLVVGGANALNCYLERDTDRYMARTARRPLPAGRMAPPVALVFGLLLSAISIPLLTFGANPLSGLLAAVALLSYVLVYTPLKRRSSVSTLVGALPGALPPLIGWVAATGRPDAGGLVLFGILFLWQIPHSLAIGLYRAPEYARAGLVVFPLEHGEEATRRQMVLYTLPLIVLPLALVHLGVAGLFTLVAGGLLGVGFLALTVQGLVRGSGATWARRVFFASLVYLTGLFGVLGLDRLLL